MFATIRRKVLELILLVLFFVCTLLMFKSSSDPHPEITKGTWVESLFRPFPTGNQITFDITVGVIVSLFVYILVVRVPERQKRRRLKANLRHQYEALKEETILQFLWACNESANIDLIDRLKNPKAFKDFFKGRVSESQDRWHSVM